MNDFLKKLSDRDLAELSHALRTGRLSSPFSEISLERVVSKEVVEPSASLLRQLTSWDFSNAQIVHTLDMLRTDRCRRSNLECDLELVTTGPDIEGVSNRDTSVVVRDLFTHATESVLIAGYAVYQGQKVFQSLADRMLTHPSLDVKLFLDIPRARGDTSSVSEITTRFAQHFLLNQWPAGRPHPRLHFDPRSLNESSLSKSCLHAKVVVVDNVRVFVTSANFTEAAQQRNVEIGILAHSAMLASRVTEFFERGVANGSFHTVRNPMT